MPRHPPADQTDDERAVTAFKDVYDDLTKSTQTRLDAVTRTGERLRQALASRSPHVVIPRVSLIPSRKGFTVNPLSKEEYVLTGIQALAHAMRNDVPAVQINAALELARVPHAHALTVLANNYLYLPRDSSFVQAAWHGPFFQRVAQHADRAHALAVFQKGLEDVNLNANRAVFTTLLNESDADPATLVRLVQTVLLQNVRAQNATQTAERLYGTFPYLNNAAQVEPLVRFSRLILPYTRFSINAHHLIHEAIADFQHEPAARRAVFQALRRMDGLLAKDDDSTLTESAPVAIYAYNDALNHPTRLANVRTAKLHLAQLRTVHAANQAK